MRLVVGINISVGMKVKRVCVKELFASGNQANVLRQHS